MIPEPEPYTSLLYPALIGIGVVLFFSLMVAWGACSFHNAWRKAHGLSLPEDKEPK